ncbi:patatin-like protein [Caballeronia sp. LjRoot29]|uniref:patatin-like protein n=1 Tax=Caballeronia sp. LjRoot29 TaxID=3342315 RepID=UPI003ECFB2DB
MNDDNLEELRIALVMNGGVSLAVWMGGVTSEIYRLVKEQHPVYSGLLALTHSVARVDVISGTSAGGVNGAALSLALLYDSDFFMLRDVWMKMGAFQDLLRNPLDKNPGSLLRGDDYFLPQIQAAFSRLAKTDQATEASKPCGYAPEAMPIDLRLTTTLLRGRLACTVDDLGIPVGDMDHRARFRFQHANGVNHFDNRTTLVQWLSRAARSTASFPFAFEPSKVPPSCAPDDLGKLLDVNDKPITDQPADMSRCVIDGGILDNKPFRGALRSIFAMKTRRSVRRVIAYINPDPGKSAQAVDPFNAPPAQTGPNAPYIPSPPEPDPQLGAVVGSSLFGIPQSQSIIDQLNDVQVHNAHVRTRRNKVLDIVGQFLKSARDPSGKNAPDAETTACALFELYRKRRIAYTFDTFVNVTLPAAALKETRLNDVVSIMGKNGAQTIRLKFGNVPWSGWIPTQWPTGEDWADAPGEGPCARNAQWAWGQLPVDFAAKVLLNLLRLTQRLRDIAGLGNLKLDVNAALSYNPSNVVRNAGWADGNRPPSRAFSRSEEAAAKVMRGLWEEAYACVDELTRLHKCEDEQWIGKIGKQLDALAAQVSGDTPKRPYRLTLEQACDENTLARLFSPVDDAVRNETCANVMYRIAETVLRTCPVASAAVSTLKDQKLNDIDSASHAGVDALIGFLCAPTKTGGQNTATTVVHRLLQIEVINFALNDRSDLEDDSLIELVQISGNGRSPLGGMEAARDKLLGLQLAHFAAFYKKSWRANDWLYGRFDGSERLVKILLSPERLWRVYRNNKKGAKEAIKSIAVRSVKSADLYAELDAAWTAEFDALVDEELSFLDSKEGILPDMLSACAQAITLRLHYGILQEEIRNVYDAVIDDQSNGADASGVGEACRARLAKEAQGGAFSLNESRAVFRDGLIGGETLLGQAGSDLFTRTFAKTLATTQKTLANAGSNLGPVSGLFSSVRVPILGFFFVANGLTRQSRTSAALHGAILAIGAAIVAMQFLWTPADFAEGQTLPGVLVTVGWALLAYGVLMSVFQAPRLMLGAFVATLVVAALIALLAGAPVAWVLIAAFVLMIAFSVRWLWLQWPVGILVVVGAGLWGSGYGGDLMHRSGDGCRDQVTAQVQSARVPGAELQRVQSTRVAALSAPADPTKKAPPQGNCVKTNPQHSVMLFSLIIAVAISVAVWSASPHPKIAEGKIAQWLERRRKEKAAKAKGRCPCGAFAFDGARGAKVADNHPGNKEGNAAATGAVAANTMNSTPLA